MKWQTINSLRILEAYSHLCLSIIITIVIDINSLSPKYDFLKRNLK